MPRAHHFLSLRVHVLQVLDVFLLDHEDLGEPRLGGDGRVPFNASHSPHASQNTHGNCQKTAEGVSPEEGIRDAPLGPGT